MFSKRHYHLNEKESHRLGENTCKTCIVQRTVTRIYKEPSQLNKKITQPSKKMDTSPKMANEVTQTLSVFREMWSKMPVGYHHMPIKRVVGRTWGAGTPLHCWWEVVWPLLKKVWKCLKNANIHLPHGPACPLLDRYPKGKETGVSA